MFRITLLQRAIALCVCFHALKSEGARLSSTIDKDVSSLAQDLAYGLAKQRLTTMKFSSIQAAISGKDSSPWDEPYFAEHLTPIGNNNYYGVHVTMDVYGHELTPGQVTSTIVSVTHTGDGKKSSYNAVQAGWHIYPEHYGDSLPRFYTYWTRDGYDATGCFNMECSGFVRADGAVIAPGDVIKPVSVVTGGPIQNITLRLLKDKTTGDWWVYCGFNSDPQEVGYFPKSIFTYLAEKPNGMDLGASVIAKKTIPTPPMGSGALPNGGQGRAASFTNLKFIDQDGRSSPITADWPEILTNDKCHSITPIDHAAFQYGGPGGCVR